MIIVIENGGDGLDAILAIEGWREMVRAGRIRVEGYDPEELEQLLCQHQIEREGWPGE